MVYTGEKISIGLGQDGLTGNVNLSQVSPSRLLEANNITYENGTLQKEGGAELYTDAAIGGTPEVIGGWDWDHDGVSQRAIVMTSAGTILKDSGGGTFGDTLKSGLTASDVVPIFVEGGKEGAALDRKLFIFTGKNAVQVLAADGATTSDLATPPADWASGNPSFGLNHEDRIWGGGNTNDPHRLYYSTTTDHEGFTGTGSGSLSVFPGEGERLVAAVSFKGIVIAAKFPKGLYVVDTTDVTVSNWRVDRLTDKIGAQNGLMMFLISDDVIMMDTSGNVHLVSAALEFGNFLNSSLSDAQDMGPFIRRNINLSGLGLVQGIFYEAKRQVHFAVPGIGSSIPERRLVVDFNRPDFPRFRFSDFDSSRSIWLYKDPDGIPRPRIGSAGGEVFNLDTTARSLEFLVGSVVNTQGYEGKFRTSSDDFSRADPALGTLRKNGSFLELVVEPTGDWNLSVDILWDDEVTQTVQFNLGTTGATLGSFTLDTDKLANDRVTNKRQRITGGGRRFAIAGRNSGDAQDFSIAEAILYYKRSNERL
ncbi:MAG: hypothetical protein ACR2RF_25475 [Geminicoccaceae bacterium]